MAAKTKTTADRAREVLMAGGRFEDGHLITRMGNIVRGIGVATFYEMAEKGEIDIVRVNSRLAYWVLCAQHPSDAHARKALRDFLRHDPALTVIDHTELARRLYARGLRAPSPRRENP